VCLLLQDLEYKTVCVGRGGILGDMCYERRRAEACVNLSVVCVSVFITAGPRAIPGGVCGCSLSSGVHFGPQIHLKEKSTAVQTGMKLRLSNTVPQGDLECLSDTVPRYEILTFHSVKYVQIIPKT
jgi:hypothetical protein